jgi:hypothetical protein
MIWRKTIVVILISICLALIYIWQKSNWVVTDEASTPSPTVIASNQPTSTPTPAPTLEPIAMPYIAPLTGLPSEIENIKRPIVVMIENHHLARPQSGLNQADLIYEVLAEGDITRFIAVFQSQSPKTIGPVRSIRPYFVELGNAINGILVHAGWSQDAMDAMLAKKVNHLDELYGDGDAYWRSSDRKPPHNLYTSIEKINKRIAARKFRTNGDPISYVYEPIATSQQNSTTEDANAKNTREKQATRVQIPYQNGYQVSYQYQAEKNIYVRSMNNQAHLDRESSQPLIASNVIVVEAPHKILDEVGRRAVNVMGPGKGAIFQNGMTQKITWKLHNGLIRAYVNEQEVSMVPGVTWVQIVPIGTLANMKVE